MRASWPGPGSSPPVGHGLAACGHATTHERPLCDPDAPLLAIASIVRTGPAERPPIARYPPRMRPSTRDVIGATLFVAVLLVLLVLSVAAALPPAK